MPLKLTITHCTVRGFSTGIDTFTGSAAAGVNFLIADTVVTNNQTGIIAAVGGGTLDHVVANQNTQEGVRVGDRIGVTAVDTIADDNGTGFAILSFRSSLSLAHSTATGNGTGVNVIAGSAISFGDNHIHGNGTDVKGTLTKVGTQ